MKETAGTPSSSSQRTHTQTHLLRLTDSELQHEGSSLKGTSGTHRETEASGIKVCRGHCPFSKPSTHKARKLVPYLRLHTRTTLFYPTWRSPETLPHPTYGPTQAIFPYEWMVLAHAEQLTKSSQTSNSCPQ